MDALAVDTAYRAAIDRALGQQTDEFWAEAYTTTGASEPRRLETSRSDRRA